MCSPLICSGHWRVVRGFALVCVCVHVCLPFGVCACVRVCMSERTAQAVTYTAAETTQRGGGAGADQTKTGGGGEGTWCCSDWLCPSSHAYAHAQTHTHTHVQPLHSPPPSLPPTTPPPSHMLFCDGEDGEEREGLCCLQTFTPPLQRWTAPCAADWSDRSKESAYMCGGKKKKKGQERDQNTPTNQYSRR